MLSSGRFLGSVCLALSLFIASPVSRAESLLIWPLMPTLASGAKSVAIHIENTGQTSRTLQFRVLQWQQPNHTDHGWDSTGRHETYHQQQRVIASPPVATIAPESTQLIRLVYFQGTVPEAEQEQAYRVLIDDITPIAADNDNAFNFRMRYSVPLFLSRPQTVPMPKKTGSYSDYLNEHINVYCRAIDDETAELHIHNHGAVHLRLAQLQVLGAEQQTLFHNGEGLFGYVLPGAKQRWQLPVSCNQLQQGELNARAHQVSLQMDVQPHFRSPVNDDEDEEELTNELSAVTD
ncbi:molecular chaperone [Idiomarina xiamenensis]|uniref:Pili assembly chaperone n=1 Tax=Idiomarina xiamenensis 10-D-4 TaxID=740709 RepID=K2KHH6_9GAMM|nr:fimbria/pilus periplasmic chaperone [Idiomarina xiamenensis]EKE82114.1 pili assembly chaperone [Idiomarina xiamenensis 10-D-4]